MTTDLRYPIGMFTPPQPLSPDERAARIRQIAEVPAHLRAAVDDLTDAQLDTPYRPGGWTVRQVVHHLVDSHINALVRLKLALTEDTPTIRAYDQAAWAALPDAAGPIAPSLGLLDHLHDRWVSLWRLMTEEDWARALHHPEAGELRLDVLLALYAWHGRHHVAHITRLREREGW